MPRPSLTLAAGLTLAVSAACAKHEKAQQAASESAAPSATAPTAPTAIATTPTAPPPPDPKEAARESGLLGPTDQGAFASDFDSAGAGSAANKPIAKGKGSAVSTDRKSGAKLIAPSPSAGGGGGGQGGGGGGQGGGEDNSHPTRSAQRINGGVTITDISAGDDRAKDPVRDAVAAHLGAIEACYRDTLSRAPAVAGKFDVVFFVDPDGTFERAAQLSSELGDGLLGDCIIKTVDGIKLDHAVGGTKPIKVGVVLSFKHT